MTSGDAALDLEHPSPGPKPLARVYGEPVNELPQDLYIPPEALEVFRRALEIHPNLQRIPDMVKSLSEKIEGRAI